MASEMVGSWVEEMNKIKEKARENHQKITGKSRGIANASTLIMKNKMQESLSKKEDKNSKNSSCSEEICSIPDSTMCFIFDRFVPC